jgi:uncharacterized protein (UPF0332 family)
MTTKADYIKYKLEKANNTLEAAELLLKNNFWADAMSKIYYAAFYTANALLNNITLYPKTHLGTKSLFNKEFIQTSIVDKEMGELYSTLLAKRFEADYEDFVMIDEEKVKEYLVKVHEFLVTSKSILENKLDDKS